MADRSEKYNSAFTGVDIDSAVRRVLSGDLDGVKSFNGRAGDVVPQDGDYTAGMVGAATPDQVTEAVSLVMEAVSQKQDKLTGTVGQVVGFNRYGEAVAQDISSGGGGGELPVKVTILQTICKDIVLDDNSPSYTLPNPITLDPDALYYLDLKYYGADGSLSDVNSGACFSRALSSTYVQWLGSLSTSRVTLTSTTIGSTWRGSGATAILSIYEVYLEITDKMILSAINQEGLMTTASGSYSHAEGYATTASGLYAHAEGSATTASGTHSHAEGGKTTVSGSYSHAEGYATTASGSYAHSGGSCTIAAGSYQTAIGRYNKSSTLSTDKLIIGAGAINARANCFRVTDTGVFSVGNYAAAGADYAELFEWADGNPEAQDRAGLFVALDGDKIRIATPEDDYILGIVSGAPSVVGGVYDDQWAGMFLTDIFGRPLWEDVEVTEETDDEGNAVSPTRIERQRKLNPDYDSTREYQPRTERPEWDAVGLLGKLVAADDGTCRPNGYAAVSEGGKATASTGRTKYRVMARLDESHIRLMIL